MLTTVCEIFQIGYSSKRGAVSYVAVLPAGYGLATRGAGQEADGAAEGWQVGSGGGGGGDSEACCSVLEDF